MNLKLVDASKNGGNQKTTQGVGWFTRSFHLSLVSNSCLEVLVIRVFVVGKKVPTTKHMDPSLSKEKTLDSKGSWCIKTPPMSILSRNDFMPGNPNGSWKR